IDSTSKDLYFYSLFNVIKAFQKYKSNLRELTVLTNELHGIIGQDSHFSSNKSLGIGLLKVIGQEFPTTITGHIDISLSESSDLSYQSKLFEEIMHPEPGKVISYRNSCRWVQIYERVKVASGSSSAGFKHNGVYLITGGLGGFGYTIAKYLSKHFSAKLILLGREELPAREEWQGYSDGIHFNKSIKTKIERIQSVENEGGQVLYLDCDISSLRQFSEVVSVSEERFGALNGVFHAAGITSGKSINSIDRLTRVDCENQFASKIEGLIVLHEAFRDRKLDFCISTSSLAAILGGLGFGAYSAANTFMDYFIRDHKKQGLLENWISVNFDGINFSDEQNDYINSHELPDLINNILALKEFCQLVVSTKELQPRLDDWIGKRNSFENSKEE
ncbi:MAG: hypothetical protein C0490_26545, partial [Marivirga sp.]|nr:hypothetical protein [Marivirga sp.]